jgi:outer membrane immunogenic protein
MHRIVFASLAALGMTVGTASAADLARPTQAPVYTKAPAPAPSLSWTGCYLGGNAGGAWVHNKEFDPASGIDLASDGPGGFIGGGQLGCDYQVSNWVFGVQGSYDWDDIKGSHNAGDPNIPALTSISNEDRYLATATARIGYTVVPSVLLYAKGGAAWTSNDITLSGVGGPFDSATDSNRIGWTAGGGVEYLFTPNWSIFAEYKYAAFGSHTVDFPVSGPLTISQDFQSAVAGVNFHLKPW